MPATLILAMLAAATPLSAETTRPPADNHAPPPAVTVRWMAKPSTGAELALIARIEFTRPLRGGDLSVTVPSGLRLVEGPTRLKVSAPADLSPVEVGYRFAVVGPVSADLVLAFNAGNVHAEATYRPRDLAQPERDPEKGPQPERAVGQ